MSSIAVPRASYRRRRRAAGGKGRLERLFTLIILFLVIVLALELAFHFFVAPRLRIRDIELSVAKGFPLSNTELLQIAGLTGPEYYYSVSPSRIAARLDAYPAVKSAVVRRLFPNRLSISIVERKPLVVALVDSTGRVVPVAFDAEGVAVEVGQSITNYDLPIISGVTIPSIRPGMRMPVELVGFLKSLRKIKDTSPLLLAQISEIRFERGSGAGFDAVLYPTSYRVPVIVGDTIDAHELKYIMMVLDVVQKEGMSAKLADLDFRTGQVVYKLKEGSHSASG